MSVRCRYRVLVLFVAFISCFCGVNASGGVLVINWVGGSGNYSDPNKWDLNVVPCNTGNLEFDVRIPASSTVTFDLADCAVTHCTLDGTFNLLPGTRFEILDIAQIHGLIDADGGDFFADSLNASFPGNRALVPHE